jgi:hypothetical protein
MEVKPIINAVFACLTVVSFNANSALIDAGNGTVLDDDMGIYWLANANLAETNSFGVSGIQSDGSMSLETAYDWVAAMNIAGYLGFNDWRIPFASPIDHSCTDDTGGTSPRSDGVGYNCSGGEMGHLYYEELSGVAGNQISTSGDDNLSLFYNIQDESYSPYWYENGYPPYPDSNLGRRFSFYNGETWIPASGNLLYVWAVRDAPVVPIPAAIWLFGSGLLGLIGIARRKS